MDTDAILATSTAVAVLGCFFIVLLTNLISCNNCRRKCPRERAETDEELITP